MDVEQKVRDCVESRITRLTREYNKYPILQEILKLDKYDCYEIFGISNTYPEDLDQLLSLVINGLYDDSQLGAVSGRHSYYINYVSDNHVNQIYEDDLFRIIQLCNDRTEYRESNSELLNNYPLDRDRIRPIYEEFKRLDNLFKNEILKFKEV